MSSTAGATDSAAEAPGATAATAGAVDLMWTIQLEVIVTREQKLTHLLLLLLLRLLIHRRLQNGLYKSPIP